MNELEEKFYETGVVPVVVLEDAEDAVPLAQALVEGGLLSAEVTFRTAAAEESIRRMTELFHRCWWEPARCLRRSRSMRLQQPVQSLS